MTIRHVLFLKWFSGRRCNTATPALETASSNSCGLDSFEHLTVPTTLIISSDPETIRFVGGLDLYSAESARAELLACCATRPALVLDLSGVSVCDAAGWQLLLAVRQTAVAAGKAFSLQAVSPAIEECRNLLGLAPECGQSHTT